MLQVKHIYVKQDHKDVSDKWVAWYTTVFISAMLLPVVLPLSVVENLIYSALHQPAWLKIEVGMSLRKHSTRRHKPRFEEHSMMFISSPEASGTLSLSFTDIMHHEGTSQICNELCIKSLMKKKVLLNSFAWNVIKFGRLVCSITANQPAKFNVNPSSG